MEKQGLITKTKEVNGNSRVKVKMTTKGEEITASLVGERYLRQVMSSLTPEKLEQLDSCLALIRDNGNRATRYSGEDDSSAVESIQILS